MLWLCVHARGSLDAEVLWKAGSSRWGMGHLAGSPCGPHPVGDCSSAPIGAPISRKYASCGASSLPSFPQGQCEADVRNNRKQTPLLLAVSQGHCAIAELLLGAGGAQVNAEDEDADTALHLALIKRSAIRPQDLDPAEAPVIAGVRGGTVALCPFGLYFLTRVCGMILSDSVRLFGVCDVPN